MARKQATAQTESTAVTKSGGQRIVGQVQMTALSVVKPNPWNPNRMTPFMKESLRVGLETDGWLSSKSLLVWGRDDKNQVKNLIIDGEHRWMVAGEMGFLEGPMVFLYGLSESQAKALTVKMNMKRGEFDAADLGSLIRSIQYELGAADLALDLGIEQTDLAGFLIEPGIALAPEAPTVLDDALPAGKTPHVKMVQLFFDEKQHDEFMQGVLAASKVYSKKNVTDTVMEVLRHG